VAHGARIGLHAGDRLLGERLGRLLPPGARPLSGDAVDTTFRVIPCDGEAGGSSALVDLRRDDRTIGRGLALTEALARLESELDFAVARLARDCIFVHAGVVAWRGSAILIPGRSMSGKSTLVHALVAAGATYYSDEYAIIDEAGLVHAYPRAIRLRGVIRAHTAPREEMHDLPPIQAGLVVSARHRSGALCRPRPLTRRESLFRLIRNTVHARLDPGRVLASLAPLVLHAHAIEGARGEACDAAQPILALCSADRVVDFDIGFSHARPHPGSGGASHAAHPIAR